MKKGFFRRVANRWLHLLAQVSPGATTLRPMLHRLRGVTVGRNVFIGDGVYLDNEFPECIEIQDGVQISIRTVFVAHTRGSGKVVVERNAFVGPNCVIVCSAGRTLRIGRGAVVGAGSVVTKSIPAGIYVAPPSPTPLARVTLPFPLAESMEEFWAGLTMLDKHGTGRRPRPGVPIREKPADPMT